MNIVTRLSDWKLNYQVAAFGAYATILVKSIYLILRGFESSSLLSISILNNASAVLVTGFSANSSTPFAILRICLTSLFLLWAIICQGNEGFDGTYAILCSVAHFTYQLGLQHRGVVSEEPYQHEKCANAEEAPSKSLHAPPMDKNDAARFSGSLRMFFGDSLCLDGAIVPVTILGTAMTYRVFDFDLGFGLVFAFMSAFISSIILLFIHRVEMQGLRVDTHKYVQLLVSLLLVIGAFCFILFTTLESPDIEFSWWRIAFGVAWFMFLFRTSFIACRFLTHATVFPCEACNQRQSGIHGPLTYDASASCIWNNESMLPALDQEKGSTSEEATFWIRRQKGPDLVIRFWLNDQEWFQISPRTFVIFFVSCLVLTAFSSGALNPDGIFANIGSHISKVTAFYVTMAFTFVSTDHTAVGDSPELMFVSPKHSFPEWKAIAKSLIITVLVHIYIVFVAPVDRFTIFVTPIASTVMTPVLVAGISRPLTPSARQGNSEPSTEAKTVSVSSDELVHSTARTWNIDSTLVYSSSRIRCLDIRVLLLGLSIALFDVLSNRYQNQPSVTGWPKSAMISISVTAAWLYLENMLPSSQDLEPGILSLVVTALVSNSSSVIFPKALELEEWGNEVSAHETPLPEEGSYPKLLLTALWFATLVSMVVVNRRLVHSQADKALQSTNKQPAKEDHLLFGFRVKTSKVNFAWQLRNSRIAISLVSAMLASFLGEKWPVEGNTTAVSLMLLTLIIGFQVQPRWDEVDEKRSLPHVAALGLTTLMTILIVALNRYGLLQTLLSDPNSDWKAGTWSAMVFYQLFLAITLRFEGKGCFKNMNHVVESLEGNLQDEEKGMAQAGEAQMLLDPT